MSYIGDQVFQRKQNSYHGAAEILNVVGEDDAKKYLAVYFSWFSENFGKVCLATAMLRWSRVR